jgi:molybdopterin molybdotransferase
MEHCRDDRAALLQTIRRLTGLNDPSASGAATANARSEGTDVVVLSGGVSVGEHDLVQETLRALGAKIEIWRVAIKPGKPFLFARLGECMIFGLPGNPVSAFVTWLRLVRPAVLKMNGAGEAELSLRTVPATLGVDVSNKGDRRHYLRGRVSDGHFVPVGRQESHALFGLSRADALLRVDCGVEYQAGRIVAVELFD